MIRTLLIIAGAALVLSIVTLGGAAALGGSDLARHDWSWTIDEDGDKTTIRRATSIDVQGPETTRTVPWTGGDRLIVALPADVTYVQGDANTVVVTGPQAIVNRVRIDASRLSMIDGSDRATVSIGRGSIHGWSDSERLKIVVTTTSVQRFDLEGSSDLTIQDYDHDALAINVTGSGDIVATGRTRTLTLDMTGSGDVDLSDLATTDVTISTSGSGDATIAPTGSADIQTSGSGDVDLTTRPAKFSSAVTGSGDVNQN